MTFIPGQPRCLRSKYLPGPTYAGYVAMTLIQTIAAPFRQSRKNKLKRTEIIYFLAFERKWMSIAQANLIISRAESGGLLVSEGEWVSPLFNPGVVDLPLGFRPSSDIFAEEDPVNIIIARIMKTTSRSETEITADLNRIIREEFDGVLWPEAAIILLARRHLIAFEDILPLLREQAIKKE